MRNKSYKSQAIILSTKEFSEADKFVIVYSKDYGKLHLIAKGVKRLQSRKRGHIDVFNLIRFQAYEGRNFGIITEVEVMDTFGKFRKNLRKVSLAYYFMEVIEKITHDNEPHPEVFYLLLNYLTKLQNSKELKVLRTRFVVELLVILGFWPKSTILPDPDIKLSEVIERNLSSVRVGRRLSA